ncbi:MAG: Bax inhibitor-1/YccA family protein [Pseudomonadota bacterium]
MVGPNQQVYSRTQSAEAIDAGLRTYMLRVYNYMSLGVAFTGALGFLIASNEALVQSLGNLFLVFFIGILVMGFVAPKIIMSKSMVAAQAAYWVYAGLWGMALAPMFYAYGQMDPMLIVRAFLITAGAFAGVSLFGYTTKRNLSAFQTFFVMAAIGLLIALLVNAFLIQSGAFAFFIYAAVVLVFSGITAWQTQMIKNMYVEQEAGDVTQRKAIFGAFMLYGSFITLFIYILSILGMMRE